ncbi:Rad52/Rad22 family DNA repair protein [Bengtsoniella intestinalis]|uniref:Rad52/Rad22 family DNA repair protein n=1 Tax=Bengtsoniella intestinalis TaxID=3073143 RepID=UPI00391F1820
MEAKTPKEIAEALAKPFAPEDLEWRVQGTNKEKTGGFAVPYITNRAIQNRLDEVVGPENWKNEFTPWHNSKDKSSQLCGLSIRYEQHGWITKWDGAENSDIEPVKGGLSDSMKRAAVQWGIGRTLYSMDTVWVSVEQKGRSCVIRDSERSNLNKKYLEMLKKLGLTHTRPTGIEAQLTSQMQPAQLQQPNLQPQQPPRESQSQQARQYQPPQNQPPMQPQLSPQNQPPMQQNAGWPPPQFQGKPLPKGKQQAPAYEFMVTDMQTQQEGHGISNALELTNPQGQKLFVYFHGPMPNVAPGTSLVGVGYRTETRGNVVFHVLERYQILNPMPQSAA